VFYLCSICRRSGFLERCVASGGLSADMGPAVLDLYRWEDVGFGIGPVADAQREVRCT
jgi:hypothetical protein